MTNMEKLAIIARLKREVEAERILLDFIKVHAAFKEYKRRVYESQKNEGQ